MLLAIDTSAGTSVAVVDREGGVLSELATTDTMRHAEVLAAKPISSLRAVKRLVTVHQKEAIASARQGEDAAFVELMGGPANAEALAAFAEKRDPDFTKLPPGW